MLYESNLLTLETIGYSLGYIVMSIVLWAQEAVHTHVIVDWDRFMQVLYLGRAPLTKETARFSEVASGNPTSTCIPRVDG